MPAPLNRGNLRQVFTSPTSGPSAAAHMGGSTAAYSALGELGRELEAFGINQALPEAEAAGAAAVHFDPETGQLTVEGLDRPVLNRIDAAWRHAAQASLQARTEIDQRTKLSELAAKFPADDEAFAKESNAYVKGQAAAAPMSAKADILLTGERLISQYRSGIASRKLQIDQQKFEDSTRALIDSKSNDLVSIVAQAGGAQTAEAASIRDEIRNLWDGLVGNPLSGVSREKADYEMKRLEGRAHAEAILRQVDRGTVGLAAAEDAIRNSGYPLDPNQVVTLVNRAEAIQSDRESKRRQSEAEALRNHGLMSDDLLKRMYDLADVGSLTVQTVQKYRNSMTAGDYRTALELARGGISSDNRNTVADLTLTLDTDAPDAFRKKVAAAMRSGDLSADTGRSLINQNTSAFRDDRPASPYRRGRDYVKSSLNPGELTADYGGRQAQSNALAEFDQWASDHPNASPQEAMEQAHQTVQRFSLIDAAQMPLAIGRPYGSNAAPGSVTEQDIASAATRLKAARSSGRIGDAEYLAEFSRLKAWKSYLMQSALRAQQLKQRPK